MTLIPEKVRYSEDCLRLIEAGLPLEGQGKARDIFGIPGNDDALLFLTSNRLSVLDWVLPVWVSDKGAMLTAVDYFNRTRLFPDLQHHLVQSEGNQGLNAVHDLRRDFPQIPLASAMVVRRYPEHVKGELIVRGYIGGSVWNDYLTTGVVAGQRLPSGLRKWQRLDEAIFTPSTKAPNGEHDVNITLEQFLDQNPGGIGETARDLCLRMYLRVHQYMEARGMLPLDMKFELAVVRTSSGFYLVVIDELATPDCSRFTPVAGYQAAMEAGTEPPSFDKEASRIHARSLQTPWDTEERHGLGALDLKDAAHQEFVANLEWPGDIVTTMTERYQDVLQTVTGMSCQEYQRSAMGIQF